MGRLSRLFPRSPGPWLAALLLGAAVTALRLWSRGGALPLFWADALETAGGILILLGLLTLVGRLGAFDTVGYAFSTFARERRYKGLFEYSAARKEKRSRGAWTFPAFAAVGLAFLIAGLLVASAARG